VGTGARRPTESPSTDTTDSDRTSRTTKAPTTTSTTREPREFATLADPLAYGEPWGREVNGLLTFRGNPTRTYYGTGPVARRTPKKQWQFPEAPMCGSSSEGGVARTWCGNGWTGQPAVFERDGRTWVVFGAYDYKVHFVDADTGERILPDFPTGDIIKGSVTIDPDGYPLVYVGSRDNYLRVLAIDRPEPVELWRLSANAVSPTLWNNDWDGSPMVLRDLLVTGGENSWFHVAKLNRGYGADGLVTVAPQLVFNTPSWDDDVLNAVGDNKMSVENSVAMLGDVAYFANSGGLLQGWDLAPLRTGTGSPTRVFRYWVGDDTDASVSIDDEGFLYVGVEYDRQTDRGREVGQMLKLDPRKPDDPLVWAVKDTGGFEHGTWSTAGHVDDLIIWPTKPGTVYGLDRATGATRWTVELPPPLMGSPAIVDGVWLQGDCNGFLHAFDVSDTDRQPRELWSVELGGCIEATPAVWKGRIYVGTRAGFVHALG
jgi:outer membrane protein assembly factor BamB